MSQMNHCSNTRERCKEQEGEAAGRGDLLRQFCSSAPLSALTGSQQKTDDLASTASTEMSAQVGEASTGGAAASTYASFYFMSREKGSYCEPGIRLTPQTAGLGIRINDNNCISRTRGTISV